MLEDLARSGLSQVDATKLGMVPLTKIKTKQLVGKNLVSFKIPYFDINGKKTEFYRVRFLEKGAGLKVTEQRYSQEKNSGVHAYLSPSIKWRDIVNNTEKSILITEGEKKAAKACKEGLPTIGLGGVWSFLDNKKIIAEFKQFNWKQRTVWIVFDSDLRTNSQVRKAMLYLAKELTELGAEVTFGYLPESKAKIGLDDYLLNHTIDELLEIESESYAAGTLLWQLNNEVAFIRNTNKYLTVDTETQHAKKPLVDGYFSNRTIVIEDSERNLFDLWTRWPQRRFHTEICYEPGQAEVTEANQYNIWKGWGCEPKKGSIKPWNDLMDYMFKDNSEFREWFMQWLAYPLQNPGTKLFTSVLIWSLKQGNGKSFIGHIMSRIYGQDNFQEIGESDLHSDFNEWTSQKQFIMGEEITGSDRRRDADKLKRMVTRERVIVNKKNQPTYTVRDCINYYLTSNHPDSMFMDTDDRRTAVHEVTGIVPPEEFFLKVDRWKDGKGPSALFYYLLNEVDCSQFNPKGAAPFTEHKKEMIELNRSDVDTFVNDLKNDPDHVLIHYGLKLERDLFTASELIEIYDQDKTRRTTSIAMSKALSRAGFKRLPMTETQEGTKKLWAVRNTDKWKKASHIERAEEYNSRERTGKDAKGKVVRMEKYKADKKDPTG